MSTRKGQATKRGKFVADSDRPVVRIVRAVSNGDGTETLELEWSAAYAEFAARMLGRRKVSATQVAQFCGATLMAGRQSPTGMFTAKPADVRTCFAKLTAQAAKAKAKRPKQTQEGL
jgi:hypothetical protein